MGAEDLPELQYLELEDVLGLYAELFGLNDEEARDRLRNEDGLRGALSRSANYAHYQTADIATQAAVLAHGIAEGQHFLEGNKRTALIALRTFLAINGYGVNATQEERANWILSLSEGASIEQLAERIRAAIIVLPPASGEG